MLKAQVSEEDEKGNFWKHDEKCNEFKTEISKLFEKIKNI